MSYILEALRRAEAERQASQGATQSLHAASGPESPAPARSRWALALALLAVLLLAALLGAWLARPASPPAVVVKPVEWPRAPLEEPPVQPVTRMPAAPKPVAVQAPSQPKAPAATAASTPAPIEAAQQAAPPPSPPRLAELQPALRQQLPALQVGGAMHSPDPSLRSLILNGQLYREGDLVAQDLRVERIDPRSAVLRFKGQAFVLNF